MSAPLAYFLTWTCYGAWLHGDEPDKDGDHGRDARATKAAEWRAKLADWRAKLAEWQATTQPATTRAGAPMYIGVPHGPTTQPAPTPARSENPP